MHEARDRGPGRPRDPAVMARDEHVYQLLAKGTRSRSALATETGHTRDTIYLSLTRLRRAGRVRQCLKNGAIVWAINDGNPCS